MSTGNDGSVDDGDQRSGQAPEASGAPVEESVEVAAAVTGDTAVRGVPGFDEGSGNEAAADQSDPDTPQFQAPVPPDAT